MTAALPDLSPLGVSDILRDPGPVLASLARVFPDGNFACTPDDLAEERRLRRSPELARLGALAGALDPDEGRGMPLIMEFLGRKTAMHSDETPFDIRLGEEAAAPRDEIVARLGEFSPEGWIMILAASVAGTEVTLDQDEAASAIGRALRDGYVPSGSTAKEREDALVHAGGLWVETITERDVAIRGWLRRMIVACTAVEVGIPLHHLRDPRCMQAIVHAVEERAREGLRVLALDTLEHVAVALVADREVRRKDGETVFAS